MASSQLIVFVRAPQPGKVKTRLAAGIGNEAAARAYRSLVDRLVHRLERLRQVELHYDPPGAEEQIRPWLQPGWTARPQAAGDLGGRMQTAFATAFNGGADRVAIIGTDCPDIAVDDIAAAWNGLDTGDLVLGPAVDGGYWLIALRAPQPILFSQMPWSTSNVLVETMARASRLGLQTRLLRELRDIDTAEDWREFVRRKAAGALGQNNQGVP